MTFNILVLEDSQSQFTAYGQALEDDGLLDKYKLIHAMNIESAKRLIEKNQIHAGIVDLSVPKSENNETSPNNGIDYLKSLLSEKQFPIAVVSANLSSLPSDDSSIPKHLETFDKKTDVHSKVFEYFETIRGLLEVTPIIPKAIKEIQSEFQDSFWELWGNWTELHTRFKPDDIDQTKTFLKRYVCSYLIEKWMADDLFNKMHHTEFYTYPPVKDRIHTGDILDLEDGCWIVMTAPCDLSNGADKYPDNLTVLQCKEEDISSNSYQKIVKPFRDSQSNQLAKDSKTKKAAELFTKQEDGCHYLPPWKTEGKPVKIIFKQIKTISFSPELRDGIKAKRVISLSAHFLPYLLQKYGSYVSRIGQADISAEDYISYLLSIVPDEINS